jgi:hypothetical protein
MEAGISTVTDKNLQLSWLTEGEPQADKVALAKVTLAHNSD